MSDIHKDYYELGEKYEECQQAIGDALGHIYCIGGPLNDNVKGYTKDQLKTFWDIATILKSVKACMVTALLLLTTPAYANVEQCDQACGENKFANMDARLVCAQLCAINVNFENLINKLIERDEKLDILYKALETQKASIEQIKSNEAYINSVTEEMVR